MRLDLKVGVVNLGYCTIPPWLSVMLLSSLLYCTVVSLACDTALAAQYGRRLHYCCKGSIDLPTSTPQCLRECGPEGWLYGNKVFLIDNRQTIQETKNTLHYSREEGYRNTKERRKMLPKLKKQRQGPKNQDAPT